MKRQPGISILLMMHQKKWILQEVWDWKDALYEETKHMTMKERIVYLNKKGEQIEKRYKLRLKKALPK